MFCTKCGTKNPENSANCYNCGQKIAAAYESSQLRSDNEVISPTNVDTRKLAQGLQDQSDSLKTQNGRQAALYGVGWHTFRHTVGTMLAEMGEHQLTIRGYLRHSNLHVTNKYL